jgi:hypothetical protein
LARCRRGATGPSSGRCRRPAGPPAARRAPRRSARSRARSRRRRLSIPTYAAARLLETSTTVDPDIRGCSPARDVDDRQSRLAWLCVDDRRSRLAWPRARSRRRRPSIPTCTAAQPRTRLRTHGCQSACGILVHGAMMWTFPTKCGSCCAGKKGISSGGWRACGVGPEGQPVGCGRTNASHGALPRGAGDGMGDAPSLPGWRLPLRGGSIPTSAAACPLETSTTVDPDSRGRAPAQDVDDHRS